MCDTCGCGDPNLVSVDVHEKILAVNDRTAAHNREHLAGQGVFTINLMGSPGAGTASPMAGRSRSAETPSTSSALVSGVPFTTRTSPSGISSMSWKNTSPTRFPSRNRRKMGCGPLVYNTWPAPSRTSGLGPKDAAAMSQVKPKKIVGSEGLPALTGEAPLAK